MCSVAYLFVQYYAAYLKSAIFSGRIRDVCIKARNLTTPLKLMIPVADIEVEKQ